MRGRAWTKGEKFALLRYVTEGPEKIAKELGRSVVAVKTMAQNINTTKDYNVIQERQECTIIQFCKDCLYDPKTCNEDVINCLAEADLYKQQYDVREITKNEPTVVIWKKKKNGKVYKTLRLPFNWN